MGLDRRSLLKALGLGAIGVAGGTADVPDEYDLVAAGQAPAGSRVAYSDEVIYQIISDRFRDGNSNNNPSGELYSSDCSDLRAYCGGDWQGIIDKIKSGYLTDMGVGAIWISPPFENITEYDSDIGTSYHGYWARDFKDPNPFFGDMQKFKDMVSVAHNNGLKVVIDFVPNHTSPSTSDNELEDGVLYDDGNYVAAYNDDPDDLFHHNGGTDYSSYEDQIYKNLYNLADFDQHENYIDQYLKNAIQQWLDTGIDGLRVDAVAHMAPEWQKALVDSIYDHQQVFTFGEWFLGADEYNQNYYEFSNQSGMSLLDFRFGQEIRQTLRDFNDDFYGLWDVIQETETEHNQVIDQVPFIDNHDMERFHIDGADKRNVEMALAVLLTSRGVPTIYYGTEQYLTGGSDPKNRKPMPAFDQTTTAYNVISKLAPLRENPAIAYGGTAERWINSDVFIYEREFGDNNVVVAINRSQSWYTVTNLQTNLPGGTYGDQLDGILDGFQTTVNSDGSIDDFDFGPQTVCVWAHNGDTSVPSLGHVGPTMAQTDHTIKLEGAGFGSTTGSVYFGSNSANVVSWSDTQIEVEVPFVAGGYYDITVEDANGNTSNAFTDFEILSDDLVTVRFIINEAYTDTGENVYISGNQHELGNWDDAAAVGPFFNQVVYEYPNWYYDVAVPAGRDIEFKFIKKDSSGNVTWESGSNRTYTTPSSGTGTYQGTWK